MSETRRSEGLDQIEIENYLELTCSELGLTIEKSGNKSRKIFADDINVFEGDIEEIMSSLQEEYPDVEFSEKTLEKGIAEISW